jgi:hypothetical protein
MTFPYNIVFWDVIPCSVVDIYCLEGTCCCHLQGRRVSHQTKKWAIIWGKEDNMRANSKPMENIYQTTCLHIPSTISVLLKLSGMKFRKTIMMPNFY